MPFRIASLLSLTYLTTSSTLSSRIFSSGTSIRLILRMASAMLFHLASWKLIIIPLPLLLDLNTDLRLAVSAPVVMLRNRAFSFFRQYFHFDCHFLKRRCVRVLIRIAAGLDIDRCFPGSIVR